MKYSQLLFIVSIFSFALYACKQKDKTDDGKKFPALSFIKSQIAHVDSSFYTITKIVTVDGVSDSSFIKREEFRNLAIDFLSMPDISDKKLSTLYKEERIFDQTLNRVIFTYLPMKENLEIEKLEVVIIPDPSGDKVRNIIISMNIIERGVSVRKNMLWQVDESFQVVKLIQRENKPEESIITKVVWNNKEN